MAELIINGGVPLFGKLSVSGSKNASLPILFATLATCGVSRIERVPDILDVRVAVKLISELGASVTRIYDTLYVDTRALFYRQPNSSLVSEIRASTYLLGSSLARFGRCTVSDFGGCNFAKRPIDMHISACQSFGARLDGDNLVCDKLTPAEIVFQKKSVGATANALILASAADGESRICGYAKEPHILNLIDFLRSAGAEISLSDTEIVVRGGELHGGSVEIIGDMIEAGSYLASALVTEGEIQVCGCNVADMSAYLSFLSSVGDDIKTEGDTITAKKGKYAAFSQISAEPYPAYPTDLQPIAAPILACRAGGIICDKVFPERFGYLDALARFGLSFELNEGAAFIKPSRLSAATVRAPDLRGGFACLLAALCARGESRITDAHLLGRGYESLVSKLTSLGADVKIIR